MGHNRLLIFARSPEPGKVKTRIGQVLGDAQALRLHTGLLRHVLHTLVPDRSWESQLWVFPDSGHQLFTTLQRELPLSVHVQQGEDLGQRMAMAAEQSLQQGYRVVLVGTDCPALQPAHLQGLFSALDQGNEAALIPAEDGGYVALALARYSQKLFRGIDWGSAHVCAQTLEALAGLGWSYRVDKPLWDVDRPADVQRLRLSGLMESCQ